MYCTVKEIIREVLDTDVPDSECVFAVVLTLCMATPVASDVRYLYSLIFAMPLLIHAGLEVKGK